MPIMASAFLTKTTLGEIPSTKSRPNMNNREHTNTKAFNAIFIASLLS
jgi:hypothetical protein